MKRIVRKVFVDYEKEEKWINEMAAKGLNLIDYSFGRYLFEEGTPGEYVYRLELLNQLPKHAESRTYIKFMEESGIECVASYLRWVYFRKKAAEGAFDIYTDYTSRIAHYKKVATLFAIVGIVNLFAALFNVFIGLSIGRETGIYFNLYISSLSWLVVFGFIPIFIKYLRKISRMKKEKQIFQ